MRSTVDGVKIFDSKIMQGLFWSTPFQNLTGNFSLPDDPEVSYAFLATGAATRNIILPRIIGNTVYGGPAGLLSGTHVLDGLYLELLNLSTVAANLLQAVSAAGDGSVSIGGTVAIGTATTATMAQYQIVNGSWFRIL